MSVRLLAERQLPRERSWRIAVLCSAGMGSLLSLSLLWLTAIPLGVPGEWTWQRISAGSDSRADVWLSLVWSLFPLGLYGLFAALGAARIERAAAHGRSLWLAGLAASGLALIVSLQDAPAEPYGSSKIPRVLYYPASSGYFFEARYHMTDLASFLAGYENLMEQGDVLHIGTHPPGLFVMHRGLQVLCDSSPRLTALLLGMQPEGVRRSFDVIAGQTAGMPQALLRNDRAALWLAALLTQFVAALTVIPLYGLLRRTSGASAAWWTTSLWPLLPAVLVFAPKSDLLYPFLGTLFLATWLSGWERRSMVLCALAGGVFWLSLCFSLAVLPVALLAALYTAGDATWGIERPQRGLRRDDWLCVVAAVAAFTVCVLAAWLLCDINLCKVWLLNYRNHAAFYGQFDRTWWKWVLVNPVETAMAAGWPAACLGLFGCRMSLSDGQTAAGSAGGPAPRQVGRCKLTAMCLCVVWGLLWISGKNSGEAARLWIPFLPWLLWLAVPAVERIVGRDSTGTSAQGPLQFAWPGLWAMQTVVCLLTLARVYGFSLS